MSPIKYSKLSPEKYKKKGIQDDHYIHIETGKFKGVDFVFRNIVFPAGFDDQDRPIVKFEYDIFYSPKQKVIKKEFDAAVAEILNIELIELIDEIHE